MTLYVVIYIKVFNSFYRNGNLLNVSWGQVDFNLIPIKSAQMLVALPLIVTLLFYYLLRPLVRFLIKLGLTKIPSIIVSFLISIGLLVLLGTLAGYTITYEFNQLVKALPETLKIAERTITALINSGNLDFLFNDEVIKRASTFMEKTIPFIGGGIFSEL